jgi:hypothetical protein
MHSDKQHALSSHELQSALMLMVEFIILGKLYQLSMQYLSYQQFCNYIPIALSWKPFRIGHMFMYTFLLRMTCTVTSRYIDLSSWDTRHVRVGW